MPCMMAENSLSRVPRSQMKNAAPTPPPGSAPAEFDDDGTYYGITPGIKLLSCDKFFFVTNEHPALQYTGYLCTVNERDNISITKKEAEFFYEFEVRKAYLQDRAGIQTALDQVSTQSWQSLSPPFARRVRRVFVVLKYGNTT